MVYYIYHQYRSEISVCIISPELVHILQEWNLQEKVLWITLLQTTAIKITREKNIFNSAFQKVKFQIRGITVVYNTIYANIGPRCVWNTFISSTFKQYHFCEYHNSYPRYAPIQMFCISALMNLFLDLSKLGLFSCTISSTAPTLWTP